jgi:hypothetical protein
MHTKFLSGDLKRREFGRPGRRREPIKIDLKLVGCEGVGWMHLVRERYQYRALVNTVMKLKVQ